MPDPFFPAVYTPVRVGAGQSLGDAAGAFLRKSGTAQADGAFFWRDQPSLLDLLIILEPEPRLDSDETLRALGAIAIVDALGASLPPQIPIHTHQNAAILVDGTMLGSIDVELPCVEQDTALRWLRIKLLLLPLGTNELSLADAGAGIVEHRALMESFARHLVYWAGQLQDHGSLVIKNAWRLREGQALAHRGGTS